MPQVEHALIVNMEYMVTTVTCRVPLTVRTIHVTCRMGHVWNVNLDYMHITVISRVQQTVKIKHVICKVELVCHASLDGPGCIVIKVRILTICIFTIQNNIYCNVCCHSPTVFDVIIGQPIYGNK